MGGSAKKSGGRFWRSVNKVVDPLNIMDPLGVLPSSWVAGKKPFKFDKNFGKLQWNLGGGGSGGGSGSGSSIRDQQTMALMAQMQAQQAAQAETARQAQQEALLQSKQKAAESAAKQGEMGAQQYLSQIDVTQQAKDAAALAGQQENFYGSAQSAMGGGYDINQSTQQALANISGTGYGSTYIPEEKLPFSGYNTDMYQKTTMPKIANKFNLPESSGLKFGGA